MAGIFVRILICSALALGIGAAPAWADDTTTPAPAPAPSEPVAPDTSILAFVSANPNCAEITDECIICAVVSGKAMCSTAGIACVRKDLRCVSTTPPTPKQ